MKQKIIAVSQTEQTGRIFYFIQTGLPLKLGIVQKKGFLKKKICPFSGSYKQAVLFIKQMAKGKTTALCLKDLCEDYKK